MINSENKKLIKDFNLNLQKKLGCDIFQLEYRYKEKELHLVQIRDSGVISKAKKRIFREVNREAVLEHDPSDDDMYLFIYGLMTCLHIVDIHIGVSVNQIKGMKAPTKVH